MKTQNGENRAHISYAVIDRQMCFASLAHPFGVDVFGRWGAI